MGPVKLSISFVEEYLADYLLEKTFSEKKFGAEVKFFIVLINTYEKIKKTSKDIVCSIGKKYGVSSV